MDQRLAYADEELSLLADYIRHYVGRHPLQAESLGITGDGSGDPHIRMLIEAVAVLNGRIRKKLADELPEVTESFLEMCAPHLLRPFPSCSIVEFCETAKGTVAPTIGIVPRGATLKSHERASDGLICKFRTAYPVSPGQAEVTGACFTSIIKAPEGTQLPNQASGDIAITLTWRDAPNAPVGKDSLRIFVDAERALCSTLIDSLFLQTGPVFVENGAGRWKRLDKNPISPAGLSPAEALLPAEAKASGAYRLLTEYFCFPSKFDFFDIDLSVLRDDSGCASGSATLHFLLAGTAADTSTARMLGALHQQHLRTACTPVINLFAKPAVPIRVNYQTCAYPLIPDALRASSYSVYSVDAVTMMQTSSASEGLIDFRPYYSLRHGETPTRKGHYWIVRQNEALAGTSPGYENAISFVDVGFNPLQIRSATASIELTCSNGRLPHEMTYGAAGGDLTVDASIGTHHIRLLRRPSLPCPRPSSRSAQWKLASALALNLASITTGSLSAFREMLTLHDFSCSDTSRTQIDGVIALEVRPARAWLNDAYGGSSVSGVEVRMTIDEAAFAASSVFLFSQVIDRVLGMLVHMNSFSRLTVVSMQTGKELLRCPTRIGELSLL